MDIRIIDHRDPLGQERVRPESELRWTLGVEQLTVPVSISAYTDFRSNQAEMERVVTDLVREAEKLLRAWERADNPRNTDQGAGGSGLPYPVAIVVRNYGASLYANARLARVRFFRKDGYRAQGSMYADESVR